MPELPEVETIRRDLSLWLKNKKITGVKVYHPRSIYPIRSSSFVAGLLSNSILTFSRVGKLLIFELKTKGFLLVHLKMTGQLIYRGKNLVAGGGHSDNPSIKGLADLPHKHTRIQIDFGKNVSLFFNDLRLFGYLKIVDELELKKIKAGFGIEPNTTAFTLTEFTKRIKSKKTSIKSVLLDQKIIAGIGNIYADESCFAAKILPTRQASTLTKVELAKLHKVINLILAKAVKLRGTTFNNFVDGFGNKGNFVKYLKVYGRGGLSCLVCKSKLQKSRVAGRGTVFCVKCQK